MLLLARVIAGSVFVAAIAVRGAERHIVNELELAGAVTPDTATSLTLTNPVRKWVFRRLLNAGAVGETMQPLQYIDVVGHGEFQSRRRRRALIVVPLIIGLACIAYFLQRP